MKDKWFYFPSIVFLALFLKELIWYSWITKYFPIHVSGDLLTYMVRMYSYINYGFHEFIPYMFGKGSLLFNGHPLGWEVYASSFYYLVKDYFLAAYIALIVSAILLFLVFYLIGRLNKFSFIKVLLFYALFLGNPLILDSVFHIGRVTEVFDWMIFSIVFLILIWYKEKPLDYKFFLFVIFYSILTLTHIYQLVLGTILVGSLFLIKDYKEKIIIGISVLISLVITSFWWIPFSKATALYPHQWSTQLELASLSSIISYNTIAILLFFVCCYYYFNNNLNKKDFIFYLPSMVLALIMISRLILFIPVLRELPPNLYSSYFIFLSLFLFLKTEFSPKIKNFVKVALILLPIICGVFIFGFYNNYSFNYKVPYEYTQINKDVLSIINFVEEKSFIAVEQEKRSNTYAAYAIVMRNKDVAIFDNLWDAPNRETIDKSFELYGSLKNRDCSSFLESINYFSIKELVSYEKECDFLKSCGFELKKRIGQACLFKITNGGL